MEIDHVLILDTEKLTWVIAENLHRRERGGDSAEAFHRFRSDAGFHATVRLLWDEIISGATRPGRVAL